MPRKDLRVTWSQQSQKWQVKADGQILASYDDKADARQTANQLYRESELEAQESGQPPEYQSVTFEPKKTTGSNGGNGRIQQAASSFSEKVNSVFAPPESSEETDDTTGSALDTILGTSDSGGQPSMPPLWDDDDDGDVQSQPTMPPLWGDDREETMEDDGPKLPPLWGDTDNDDDLEPAIPGLMPVDSDDDDDERFGPRF